MLDKNILVDGIRRIFDSKYEYFEGWPVDSEEAGERWASAFDSYASAVTPVSSSSEVGKLAFISSFKTITNSGNGIVQLPVCFHEYAIGLATGMSSSTFLGIPPPLPPALNSAFSLGLGGGSSEECADIISTVIDAWMKTGTAVHMVSGVTTNWM